MTCALRFTLAPPPSRRGGSPGCLLRYLQQPSPGASLSINAEMEPSVRIAIRTHSNLGIFPSNAVA